jgi:hypothetical protein
MSQFRRLVCRRVRSAYRAGLPKDDISRSLRYLIHEWPLPVFEKLKVDYRFKSSLGHVWNKMHVEETAKAEAKAKAAKKRARGIDLS